MRAGKFRHCDNCASALMAVNASEQEADSVMIMGSIDVIMSDRPAVASWSWSGGAVLSVDADDPGVGPVSAFVGLVSGALPSWSLFPAAGSLNAAATAATRVTSSKGSVTTRMRFMVSVMCSVGAGERSGCEIVDVDGRVNYLVGRATRVLCGEAHQNKPLKPAAIERDSHKAKGQQRSTRVALRNAKRAQHSPRRQVPPRRLKRAPDTRVETLVLPFETRCGPRRDQGSGESGSTRLK